MFGCYSCLVENRLVDLTNLLDQQIRQHFDLSYFSLDSRETTDVVDAVTTICPGCGRVYHVRHLVAGRVCLSCSSRHWAEMNLMSRIGKTI